MSFSESGKIPLLCKFIDCAVKCFGELGGFYFGFDFDDVFLLPKQICSHCEIQDSFVKREMLKCPEISTGRNCEKFYHKTQITA